MKVSLIKVSGERDSKNIGKDVKRKKKKPTT